MTATTPGGQASAPAAAAPGRARVVLLLKIAVAALLVGWLVRANSLDVRALGVLFAEPWLLAVNLGAFVACSVVLATARWRILLRIVGVELPLGRASALQLMALFFNVVIPGNVGGDVVKALYVARDQPPERRTPLLLIVFVERVLGLLGLVFMAALAAAIQAPKLMAMPAIRPMLLTVFVLAAGGLLGPLVLLLVVRAFGRRAEALLSGPSRLGQLLGRVVAAGRLVLSQPRRLVLALVVSMAMHGVAMGYFTVLTRVIGGHAVDYGAVATVFPIGLLTIVLPISPAGFGVGHLAFDRLYAAVGLSGGATIFNVFLVGQIVPCTVGLIPYLLLRVRSVVPDQGA